MQGAVLPVEIVLEDAATVFEVGGVVCQVIVGTADFRFPEGHDLHQALGSGPGHGESIEPTFYLDDRQDELRWHVGTIRRLVDLAQ